MRGKAVKQKNILQPDKKYHHPLVAQLINKIMISGKKVTAENIIYRAVEIIHQKTNLDALMVFEKAISNASPILEVRPKRIGGATYQVPMEVRSARKTSLALRWIIQSARSRQGKPFAEFLAEELVDAYNETGTAMRKKEEMHKMAEANKAFAHFARF